MVTRNEVETDESKSMAEKIQQWHHTASMIVTLCFPFLTMFTGWIANEVVTNGKAIVAIEANRYTAADALKDRRDWQQELKEIRALLHSLDRKSDNRDPPEWFERRVENIELELQRIRQDIADLKKNGN